MTSAPPRQLTALLTNQQLARIERLRIQSSRRFTNRSRGEHRARGGGRSLEFKDYRDYVAGDDIRFLDWNVFARLRRPYVKLFHDEEELHVVLLVDASTSMTFEGKLLCAQRLAAALGVMGLLSGERVSVHVFSERDGGTRSLTAPRGRKGMRPLLRFLEEIDGGGASQLEEALAAMAKTHRGRGVLVIVSDFLTPADLRASLNLAHGRGLEVFGLQVLGPSELRPEMQSDLRLVDSETDRTLDVTATDDLLAIYAEHRESLQHRLETMCRQRDGRYVAVDSGEGIDQVLFERLRRKGWIG